MGSAWGPEGHVKGLRKHLHCLAWGTYLAFALSTQSYGAAPRRLPSVPQSDTQAAEPVPVDRPPNLMALWTIRFGNWRNRSRTFVSGNLSRASQRLRKQKCGFCTRDAPFILAFI